MNNTDKILIKRISKLTSQQKNYLSNFIDYLFQEDQSSQEQVFSYPQKEN